MSDIQSPATHTMQSPASHLQRDRWLARVYITTAYLLGAVIVFAWTKMTGNKVQNEEDLAVVSTGLFLMVAVLGIPALVLLWRGMARSGRATRNAPR